MELCLLPMPRKVATGSGRFSASGATIVVPAAPSAATLFTAQKLQDALLRHAAVRPAIAVFIQCQSCIRLVVDPAGLGVEAYTLSIRPDGVVIRGGGEAGLFYGVQTLIQIIRKAGSSLPAVEIEDAPDFPNRGVMLDISRDKVPTLRTLFDLIDQFAGWKLNQVQLYMEHTFAYSQHKEVWATASPLTHEDVLRLDAYCRQRHIQLVPNQNSFGHMERWLRLPRYIDLAEAPEGSDTPWDTHWDGPFSLCPTDPRSLELLSGLYSELLPHFSSRLFNVGCDETFDIGQGKSKAAAEAVGKTRVYFDFLLKLHQLVQSNGRTMMFWGDIILHQPQLIGELPKDIIAMEWGYEAEHPFDKDGALFAKAGVPFYVCPGTSSWCTITGRTDNCIKSLISAAENGKKHGAIGYLNTDWGDYGHLQYLPVSYLGFVAGAAYSWNLAANRDLDIPRALDLHVFADAAGVMGKLIYDLGNVYKHLKTQSNSSRLFQILVAQKNNDAPAEVTRQQLDSSISAIDSIMAALPQARMDCPDANLVSREIANGAAMLRHAAKRGRWLLDRNSEKVLDLTQDLRQIIGRHEELWLARNRSGGLADSAGQLRKTLEMYSRG